MMRRCPSGYYRIDLGKARVVREGEAVTVLAYGTMVHVAAQVIAEHGIPMRTLIDLRTLAAARHRLPLRHRSKKTGRCVIIHEATRTSGFGAELSALVQERCFYHLEAPIERVTGFDTPYPHSSRMGLFPWTRFASVRLSTVLPRIFDMARFEFKLPDIGEGIAEAEVVEWFVSVGDSGGGGST